MSTRSSSRTAKSLFKDIPGKLDHIFQLVNLPQEMRNLLIKQGLSEQTIPDLTLDILLELRIPKLYATSLLRLLKQSVGIMEEPSPIRLSLTN